MQDDVLTNAIHILGDGRVVDEFRLSIDFRREFTTHANFLLGRSAHLRDNAGIDVPLADHFRILVSRERLAG